jgi:hypothetical protein
MKVVEAYRAWKSLPVNKRYSVQIRKLIPAAVRQMREMHENKKIEYLPIWDNPTIKYNHVIFGFEKAQTGMNIFLPCDSAQPIYFCFDQSGGKINPGWAGISERQDKLQFLESLNDLLNQDQGSQNPPRLFKMPTWPRVLAFGVLGALTVSAFRLISGPNFGLGDIPNPVLLNIIMYIGGFIAATPSSFLNFKWIGHHAENMVWNMLFGSKHQALAQEVNRLRSAISLKP